ncbi:hypothetical protein F5I97DRAFT_1646646 [Phlebopus sp. FC_14]|nr:hypothetical protein F5I97DRAFT_1646646 [Phlebopus sp. FC_14]
MTHILRQLSPTCVLLPPFPLSCSSTPAPIGLLIPSLFVPLDVLDAGLHTVSLWCVPLSRVFGLPCWRMSLVFSATLRLRRVTCCIAPSVPGRAILAAVSVALLFGPGLLDPSRNLNQCLLASIVQCWHSHSIRFRVICGENAVVGFVPGCPSLLLLPLLRLPCFFLIILVTLPEVLG